MFKPLTRPRGNCFALWFREGSALAFPGCAPPWSRRSGTRPNPSLFLPATRRYLTSTPSSTSLHPINAPVLSFCLRFWWITASSRLPDIICIREASRNTMTHPFPAIIMKRNFKIRKQTHGITFLTPSNNTGCLQGPWSLFQTLDLCSHL